MLIMFWGYYEIKKFWGYYEIKKKCRIDNR